MLKRLTLITATLILALALCGSVSATSDIGVTKSVNNSTPHVGDTVNFTITVTNNGPDDAAQVYVQDYISTASNGLQYVSHSASQGTYNETTGLWNITNFANGSTATLILEAMVLKSGNVTNIAAKIVPQPVPLGDDPNPGNDMASVTLSVPPAADVAVTKTVDNPVPNYGDVVTFTVTVLNNGPDTAVNTLLSDLLGPGFSLISATPSVGSYDNVTGVWTIGDLANSASATLTLVAQVIASNMTITNVANASSDIYDWNMTNNQDSVEFNIAPAADVAVTKEFWNVYGGHIITTANYGQTFMIRVNVTNNGPNNASGLQITDLTPNGLIYGLYTLESSYWYAKYYGGWIPNDPAWNNATGVWTIPYSLAPGATFSLDFYATVTGSNMTIVNWANKTAQNEYDWNISNDNASATLNVPPAADVAVTKTVDEPNPNYGDVVTFTVTVSNNGPDVAVNTLLSDLLPAGFNLTSATPSVGSYDNVTGVWTVGDLADGASATLTLVAQVIASNMTITNVANASSDTYDWNMTNNQASVEFNIPPAADIATHKEFWGPAGPYGPPITSANYGDTHVYPAIMVTNNGPDTATGVQITDLIPAGLIYNGFSAISYGNKNNWTFYDSFNNPFFDGTIWTIPELQSGQLVWLAFGVDVNASNTTIVNWANKTAEDQYDWNTSNDNDSATLDIPPAVDIGVDKRVSNEYPSIGGTVIFTIFATNFGPDNATGVQIFDLLPAGVTFVSATATQGTYDQNTGLWVIGNMSALSLVRLDITTIVNPANGSSNVTNYASVDNVDQFDWFTQNDNSNATIYLPVSDLAITKSADKTSINVGENMLWTVTLTNNGPSDATNIVVTDLLGVPGTWYTINNATASVGSFNDITGIWTIPALASGGTATLWINMTALAPSAGHNIVNTANVTSLDQFDPSNATSNATVFVQAVDIVVNKSVNNTTPNYRSNVTFTVTAHNNGPSNATGVVVTDLLPAGLVLVSATPSAGTSYNNLTGVWTIGNLANGATATLTLMAQVMDANKTITNTANLTAVNEYDTNTANNGSSVDIVVPASADIAVTKTTSNNSPLVCENFQWTITVVNNGPNDATGVVVTDLLPAGLNFVSATPSQGTYNAITGVWTVGALANGSTATLVIVTNATSGLSGVTTTNVATKTGETQYDWNTSNNAGSASIQVPAKKTFTLSVKNTGTGRVHCVYYVTVYQPCNAAPIFNRYDFYLYAGQSRTITVGTYAVGTAVSTDEFVYNVASTKRTVSVVNTWSATGLAPYVQNFVVANVPVNKAAHAMKRFWINRNVLDVFVVSPPH